MNKILGWLIVLVSAAYLVLFILSSSFLTGDINCIIIAILQVAAFCFGLKRIKRTNIPTLELKDNFNIKINSQINIEEYAKAGLELGFKATSYSYLVLLSAAFIGFISLTSMGEPISSDIIGLYMVYAVLLCRPFINYLYIKLGQKSSKVFNEPIQYTITNESIHMKGQGFDGSAQWSHFIKVKETKRFFLLYPTKKTANIIDKKLLNEDQLRTLGFFIRALPIFTA